VGTKSIEYQATQQLRIHQEGRAGNALPTVSVIIPAKNEAANLPHVLPALPSIVTEVVLVDGRSEDDTIAVALRLRPDIKVIPQSYRGKGDAVACGFAMATGDIIVMLDADGSTDPAEIPAFVKALIDGADFAKGSRYLPDGGSEDLTWLRRTGNACLTQLVNLLFGARYTDLCYGYNAFWRHCLTSLNLDSTGFEIETQLNLRAVKVGLTICEVPSVEKNRIHGESNLHPVRDGLRVLRTILRERLTRLHAPGPAWAALTGQLRYESVEPSASDKVDAALSRLLDGPVDA
jgi:glycosyltransferase involved in cell wall biosynthesis